MVILYKTRPFMNIAPTLCKVDRHCKSVVAAGKQIGIINTTIQASTIRIVINANNQCYFHIHNCRELNSINEIWNIIKVTIPRLNNVEITFCRPISFAINPGIIYPIDCRSSFITSIGCIWVSIRSFRKKPRTTANKNFLLP